MKKALAILSALTMLLSLAACSANKGNDATATDADTTVAEVTNADTSADTIGQQYLAAFKASANTTADAIADELVELGAFDSQLVKMEVEEGFLNGFDGEISGFSAGTMVSPMIGSIPFVGYVFETEDTDALLEALKASANVRWNICTEADETVYEVKDNLVFFMMCQNAAE